MQYTGKVGTPLTLTCKGVKAQAEGVAQDPTDDGHKGNGKEADLLSEYSTAETQQQ
jgi:hypothetical protein